jgi:hypothetical protein
MKKYQTMIERAIECIRNGQSPDGGFIHFSAFSSTDFSGAIPRRTTFFASNILSCLQNIPGHTGDIKNAAAGFLLSQKSERYSFNYWAHGASTETGMPCPPYPDDLDDTFAALAALLRHDPGVANGRALSSIAKILTAQEVSEGGPYRTWVVGNDMSLAWQGTDIVVNSTIGYFLSLVDVHLPALERFIESAIQKGMLASPYYPGVLHVIYFLSRFYKGHINEGNTGSRATLGDIIFRNLRRNDGENVTTLELAMAISSLVNLGHTEKVTPAMADTLVNRLEREGFLPYAFCIDPAREGRRCYAGASALTAAFCAEALALYNDRRDVPNAASIPMLHSYICSLARSACRDIGRALRETAIARIDKTSDERITTLAYEFRDAMCRSGTAVPTEITEQLSLANLYGWMAYEIYDDVLDCESDPSLIPCANFFLRALTELYATLSARIPGVMDLFHMTMDHVDNANAWEQKYCRPPATPSFGDHGTLADRSIGHAMGPLAELLFAGYGKDSDEYKNIDSFFRHYLIARQVHDDAHDWTNDLLRGRVNSVGTLVMARLKEKYRAGEVPPIDQAMTELRTIFWRDLIDDAADLITTHVNEARQTRERSLVLGGTDLMESELRKLESGARRTLKERNDILIFLKDYGASQRQI